MGQSLLYTSGRVMAGGGDVAKMVSVLTMCIESRYAEQTAGPACGYQLSQA